MGNKGQSLVELALSFVVLMLLIVGATEFGIIFFQKTQLQDAAQEGAVYGSMCPNDTVSIEDRVRNNSESPLNLLSPDVVVSINRGATTIEVVVSYNHKIFMPFLSRMLGREFIHIQGRMVNVILTENCS